MDFVTVVAIATAVATAVVGSLTFTLQARKKPTPTRTGEGSEDSSRLTLEYADLARLLVERMPDATPTERQMVLLGRYHEQGIQQSRISFWFSLIFASIGFAVIISSVLAIDRGASLTQQGRAWITLVSGTIVEAVSALFFVQSNRARRLMADFFERLRSDRKLEEALSLAKGVSDKPLKSRLQAVISLRLADVALDDGVMNGVLQEMQASALREDGPQLPSTSS
jgi:hypothetical protein